MSNTPEVAMTVIEPGGRRWAQLLNVNWSVRDLLPVIIGRLDLPERLNYELRHVRSDRVLREQDTLLSVGIAAGEELLLKPVRDKLLADLMNALYGEAVGYIAKQLWGQAESRLETILRLDPSYPDPKGLQQALGMRLPPSGTPGYSSAGQPPPPSAGSSAPSGSPQTPYSGSAQPTPLSSPPPSYSSSPPPQPAPVQASNAAAKPARSACGVLAIVMGGLVLLGVGVVVAGYVWFTRQTPEPMGVLIPTLVADSGFGAGVVDEPVLGTGDVQVTLRWDSTADLDLHVVDPGGEEIYFGVPTSSSGGQLDVDANGDCSGDPPVENVFWPTGGAPVGNYEVSIINYGTCDSSGLVNYEVTIVVDGRTVDVRNGTLTSVGEVQYVGEFSR